MWGGNEAGVLGCRRRQLPRSFLPARARLAPGERTEGEPRLTQGDFGLAQTSFRFPRIGRGEQLLCPRNLPAPRLPGDVASERRRARGACPSGADRAVVEWPGRRQRHQAQARSAADVRPRQARSAPRPVDRRSMTSRQHGNRDRAPFARRLTASGPPPRPSLAAHATALAARQARRARPQPPRIRGSGSGGRRRS